MLRKPFLIISNQLISFLLFEQSLSDSQIYSEYKFYSKREFGISKYLNFESMIALDNILNSIDRLSLFPDSASLPPDEVLAKLGYKLLIIKKHIAIYKKIGKSVFIYHIANAKMEYSRLFINK